MVLVTAHGDERLAVEAMKRGAYDYFKKPFELDDVLNVVRRALGTVRLRGGELPAAGRGHPAAQPGVRLARDVAPRRAGQPASRPRDVTVLITGESGTGKERVAEALVRASTRADKPFVRFNCAALTDGAGRGRALRPQPGRLHRARCAPRPGLFGEADGGTLLLDEVGELGASVQAQLLRVLQEGEVRPVGEERPVKVDVRLLAATHRDLAAEVKAGRFREDLYYRLNVVQLHVPAAARAARRHPVRWRATSSPASRKALRRAGGCS